MSVKGSLEEEGLASRSLKMCKECKEERICEIESMRYMGVIVFRYKSKGKKKTIKKKCMKV